MSLKKPHREGKEKLDFRGDPEVISSRGPATQQSHSPRAWRSSQRGLSGPPRRSAGLELVAPGIRLSQMRPQLTPYRKL